MKYNVLQTITRKSEGMKVYHPGDVVEMDGEAAEMLIKQGFLQAIEQKIEAPKKKSK